MGNILNDYKSVVDTSKIKSFDDVLKLVNPTLSTKGLSKNRLQERLQVGVTTRWSPSMLDNVCLSIKVWDYPFQLVFFVSEGDAEAKNILNQKQVKWIAYPANLTGDLSGIRAFIQDYGCDIVSDDDPYKGVPMLYLSALENGCGVSRWKINSALYHDLWSFAIEIGRICGIPLVGFRGSECDSSCPKHKRCFCNSITKPFHTNAVITSAQGFASQINYHKMVSEEFGDIKVYQEYLTACAIAVNQRGLVNREGTLVLQFVRFQCTVEPPIAAVESFLSLLKMKYSRTISQASIQNGKVLAKLKNTISYSSWKEFKR